MAIMGIVNTKVPKDSSDATEKAFLEYGVELHRFLTRQVHCAQMARDLAQDVYLRFMLVARQEPIRNAQAFLYQLASHLVYEYRTRQRAEHVVFDSEAVNEVDRHPVLEMRGD